VSSTVESQGPEKDEKEKKEEKKEKKKNNCGIV
jgi:hypothetical protein